MSSKSKKMRVYQVEVTNYCNASCSYCPHRIMLREKGYVSMKTVDKVVAYMESIGQRYIALHHMGEPLLHPRIGEIIWKFSKAGIGTEFSTNGLLLAKKGEEILASKPDLIRIAVDEYYNRPSYIENVCHFLEKSFDFHETSVRLHTIKGHDMTPFIYYEDGVNVLIENKTLDNWAGQLDGEESKMPPAQECYFTDHNYVVVLWDGTVATCCLDYEGRYPLTTIDKIDKIQINSPTPLCKNCKKLQFAEGGQWQL